MPDMTLEQAQARIIELTDELATVTGERDQLSHDNETLRTESEELRKLNQKYFNRLIAQDKPDPEPEPDPVPSCEEFAAKLDI